jgi:hypothetical protein
MAGFYGASDKKLVTLPFAVQGSRRSVFCFRLTFCEIGVMLPGSANDPARAQTRWGKEAPKWIN